MTTEIDAEVQAAANELGRRLAAGLNRMVAECHMLVEWTRDPVLDGDQDARGK